MMTLRNEIDVTNVEKCYWLVSRTELGQALKMELISFYASYKFLAFFSVALIFFVTFLYQDKKVKEK